MAVKVHVRTTATRVCSMDEWCDCYSKPLKKSLWCLRTLRSRFCPRRLPGGQPQARPASKRLTCIHDPYIPRDISHGMDNASLPANTEWTLASTQPAERSGLAAETSRQHYRPWSRPRRVAIRNTGNKAESPVLHTTLQLAAAKLLWEIWRGVRHSLLPRLSALHSTCVHLIVHAECLPFGDLWTVDWSARLFVTARVRNVMRAEACCVDGTNRACGVWGKTKRI
jgi:hypothetical protein